MSQFQVLLWCPKQRSLPFTLVSPNGQFKCSCGWLEKFKQRHGISFKSVCGEEKSVDLSGKRLKNGTGLCPFFWKNTSQRIFTMGMRLLSFTDWCLTKLLSSWVNFNGGKQSKERITLRLCASMSGISKLWLFVLILDVSKMLNHRQHSRRPTRKHGRWGIYSPSW